MTQIVCLANSWKNGERCIAGIEISSKKWVRPVSSLNDGRIPFNIRQIQGKEPQLLDILEIPLEDSGPDFGFQSENRSILPGEWQKVGYFYP
ncbi:MAG: hypothetical protein QNJ68_01565 [Microcoleaceae cyanobacterium MO_207.B10]|nr:hypothetical protein [Microcoleaceae cyanobacterium MO_207.B10]